MNTELNIINAMLLAIGETPVTSEASMHPSALQARAWFDLKNQEFQERGWWFNTEYKLKLSPNEAGKILLPDNVLEVLVSGDLPVVRRGDYLYDPINHTYVFAAPVSVNLILQLDANELPAKARSYLSAMCVHSFFTAEDGDEVKLKEYKENVLRTYAALIQEERKVAKVNVFNSPSVREILSPIIDAGRTPNPTYPGGYP